MVKGCQKLSRPRQFPDQARPAQRVFLTSALRSNYPGIKNCSWNQHEQPESQPQAFLSEVSCFYFTDL
jgi:hypothetical protein